MQHELLSSCTDTITSITGSLESTCFEIETLHASQLARLEENLSSFEKGLARINQLLLIYTRQEASVQQITKQCSPYYISDSGSSELETLISLLEQMPAEPHKELLQLLQIMSEINIVQYGKKVLQHLNNLLRKEQVYGLTQPKLPFQAASPFAPPVSPFLPFFASTPAAQRNPLALTPLGLFSGASEPALPSCQEVVKNFETMLKDYLPILNSYNCEVFKIDLIRELLSYYKVTQAEHKDEIINFINQISPLFTTCITTIDTIETSLRSESTANIRWFFSELKRGKYTNDLNTAMSLAQLAGFSATYVPLLFEYYWNELENLNNDRSLLQEIFTEWQKNINVILYQNRMENKPAATQAAIQPVRSKATLYQPSKEDSFNTHASIEVPIFTKRGMLL